MLLRIHPLVAAMALVFSSSAFSQTAAHTGTPDQVMDNVLVRASRTDGIAAQSDSVSNEQVRTQRPATSDTATLLKDVPGVSLNSAGGVSSLPAIHGLADDRLRIKVDGMDLISACANHMNSPLSYIDPSNVEQIKVYTGITPVSVGGDSIGGSIIVKSREPRFARAGEGLLTSGELGTFYRSNGNAWGVNAAAAIANENLSLTYSGSTAESQNYKSAKAFKNDVLATYTTAGSHLIPGDEVASTAYKAENHALGLAYRLDKHLLELKLGYQHIPYQGFPNQHMDMTDNKSTQVNLAYTGKYDWGKLEARAYHEETKHEMNFMEDKMYWYGSTANPVMIPGMPMNTEGKNSGLVVKAEINHSERDLFRVGGEYQRYRLNDWWPASFGYDAGGNMTGGMQPNTFWNINNGQRDRFDLFGEWEAAWTARWTTQIGIRSSTVMMNADEIQGYNTTATYAGTTEGKAGYFNAAERSRTDHNIDLSALARYTPDANQSYEGGYSRKTRSPSLYERYTWSNGMMAMTMNNWVNDGNGYRGNLDLKPEVAHTVSFTGDWHGADKNSWGVKATPYYSYVENYIDAACDTTVRACTSTQYNYLKLVNQDARLFGIDLSGYMALGRIAGIGDFTARGIIAYVDGKNLTTGDNLYNIMPLNARLAIDHRLGNWSTTVEEQLVSAKNDVSSVRNETKTGGYALLNLRGSYTWKNLRFDFGIENAFDKQYSLPLGGAYIGQGKTMSLGGTNTTWTSTGNPPLGYTVPGMGRSLYVGMNVKF
ncbi:TonB-dependent receptor [Quatrionicoccus australiensis]|uniref:TonB-dependent receptor n=1 Tax=Quatrionicoccus australiensis TaxID=138118 RepID=UPI001CFB680C|nr:TonB-dependent receptor [Quatrionicoccus australiensis]MCB4359039.1 TonB-dependent receptor [Quatrionicoccus australiensis]